MLDYQNSYLHYPARLGTRRVHQETPFVHFDLGAPRAPIYAASVAHLCRRLSNEVLLALIYAVSVVLRYRTLRRGNVAVPLAASGAPFVACSR